MSLNGKLELSLNAEGRFGFLSFNFGYRPEGSYELTAWITDDADKLNYKNWKCDVTFGELCSNCGRECGMKKQRQATLTNDTSSSTFSLISLPATYVQGLAPFTCSHFGVKLLLLVFIHEKSVPNCKCDSGPKLEDKKIRFTDEIEAKKFNANLKIRFEDSDDPVFVNRELLSVYSNVFRVMFEGDFKEKNAEEIKLGLKREDFLSFLECLYLPPAPITSCNFKTVVTISDRYDCAYLIQNCKKFAEEEAKTISTIEECKDLIEISERLGWQEIMAEALRVNFIVDLLDWEWMMARKKTTVNLLFMRMKNLLHYNAQCVCSLRSYTSMFVPTTSRFTDEEESKKLNATCTLRFQDSDEPVFVNRELLTVYSVVFRAMFKEDLKENEIKLDVKREDFLYFLDCLYFPTAEVTSNNFKAVLIVAKRFDCPQLFDKCKEFAEKEASKARTIEDCKDYIEVAEHLDWNNLTVIKSMKKKGVNIFMELLDSDWIDERKPSTQQALYEGMKEVVMTHVK